MSRLYLGFKTQFVSKDTLLEDLKELTDEDFNGNNGLECTSDIAIENGFDTDLEYHFDKFLKEDDSDLTSLIGYIINANYNCTEQSYYSEMEFEVITIDADTVYVSLAYTC